jgi:hypothetical protein
MFKNYSWFARLAICSSVAVLSIAAAGCGSTASKSSVASQSGTAVPLPENTVQTGGTSASSSGSGGGVSVASDSVPGNVSTTISTDPKQAMLAFTKCVRGKGVEIADPDGSGTPPNIPTGAAAEDAIKACQSLLTGGRPGGGEITAEQKGQILEMAKCMRKNGFPDFPDPEISSSGAVNLGKGIDVNDPKIRDAMGACAKTLGLGTGPTP